MLFYKIGLQCQTIVIKQIRDFFTYSFIKMPRIRQIQTRGIDFFFRLLILPWQPLQSS